MDLRYIYGNPTTSAHNMGNCIAVIAYSDFISEPLKFPVAGQPLITVQQYAHMTVMLNMARDMIFQRNNNLMRTRVWELRRSDIYNADNIRLSLFSMKESIKYLMFIATFRDQLLPGLINLQPPHGSKFRDNYIKKLNYLKYMCNYDPTKSNDNNESGRKL